MRGSCLWNDPHCGGMNYVQILSAAPKIMYSQRNLNTAEIDLLFLDYYIVLKKLLNFFSVHNVSTALLITPIPAERNVSNSVLKLFKAITKFCPGLLVEYGFHVGIPWRP